MIVTDEVKLEFLGRKVSRANILHDGKTLRLKVI
jgi:hypothetical protein